MGVAFLCCCGGGGTPCSITVTAVLSVTCGGSTTLLNGATIAVKNGGTTLGTITYASGASNSVTFSAPAGTYTVVYTLPAPYGFTRTTTATLACGSNTVSAAFVLKLTCTPVMHYALKFSANTLVDTGDTPVVTLPTPTGATGSWALAAGTYTFTLTSDVTLGALGTSLAVTYKGLTITATRAAGACVFSMPDQFLDGVGVTVHQMPGCTFNAPFTTFTTHGQTATTDGDGDAVVSLTTAEVYNATTNPCVYTMCV